MLRRGYSGEKNGDQSLPVTFYSASKVELAITGLFFYLSHSLNKPSFSQNNTFLVHIHLPFDKCTLLLLSQELTIMSFLSQELIILS